MPKREINAQKLVHLELLSYLCIRKRNKNKLYPKSRKGTEIMKHFVFKSSNGSDYELVFSTSMKQAEKDMGSKCVAAFMSKEDAEAFVWHYNNMWK